MAKIQQVDYKSVGSYATQMASTGKQYHDKMKDVYSQITSLHTYWYGQRYNTLVKAFNNMVSDVNSMSQLVVYEIPYSLKTIANNYSQADQGTNVVSASTEKPSTIASITVHNDTGMKFISSSVSQVQSKVNNDFASALNYLDSINSTFTKLKGIWDSEAASAYQSKFNSLKSSLTQSIESIKTDFTTLMNQALSDVQSAESANTVS